jgi:3-methyladenine DNA glycosylase AlkD
MPKNSITVEQIISELQQLADAKKVIFKQEKFGIIAPNSLGIYHQDLNQIAKRIGKNNELAIALFNTEIYEARLLTSKLFNPKDLSETLMDSWITVFNNWEICDSFCYSLFAKSQYAVPKAIEWTKRQTEFEKRAGFATIAGYCFADKKAENALFEQFLLIIKESANDNTLYVKKAVNWALRNIGKRNLILQEKAILTAKEILELNTPSALWIAKDALRELQNKNVTIRHYPRT